MSISTGLNIDSNQMKQANEVKSIDYTARDYNSIKTNLINSISDLTEKWTSRDESDPGIILIKLMSQFGDLMSYNLDKQILEIFPNSVTQRKNAQQLFNLIGYKMKWYRSATCKCDIVNTYELGATLAPFTTFTTVNNQITYCNVEQVELPSNTNNNGLEQQITLVQGIPKTPTKKTGAKVPGPNKPWHDIYNYNFSANDIIDCKIPLAEKSIDQDHIILIDSNNEQWELVDAVATQMSVGKFFELRIDEYDNPYLYLVNYWKNFEITNFKIFYIQTLGQAGQIMESSLINTTGAVYSVTGPVDNQRIYNVSSYIKIHNYTSTLGYNPETPDEAREEASKYVNTADTLVTLDDFTRAVARLDGVANCLATDLTNDPGYPLPSIYGDLNNDGEVNELDVEILRDYLAKIEAGLAPTITIHIKDDNKEIDQDVDITKLADLSNDGTVTSDDLELMRNYIAGDMENCGRCGRTVKLAIPLPALTVKIYIALTDEYADMGTARKLEYLEYVKTMLEDKKHIALEIIPTVDEIANYYWTIKGTVYLKTPVTMDEASDILVRINNQLSFDFRPEVTNFNEKVKFIDVVHSIEDKVDTLIDHVDLDPIEYFTSDGQTIDSRDVKGEYTIDVENNPNRVYNIQLPHAPIKPNYLSVNINTGDEILKDNGNGKIPNSNGILQEVGKVDYATGEVELKLNTDLLTPMRITYTKNSVNMAKYTNFSTLTFQVAPENIKTE